MRKRYIISGILTGLILQATHRLWLGSHKDYHFDIMLMLIVLICGFLLSLKTTSYLADFKDIKNKSRIEIVFLIIFSFLILIPLLKVDTGQISKTEKRTLALYKPFIKSDGTINTKYGKDFENFYNDRFNCRQFLIDMNILLKYWLNVNYCQNATVWMYKPGNLMYTGSAWGLEAIPDKDKSEVFNMYKNNLNRLNNYCNKNNIRLYILIVPRKIDFFNYKLADSRKYITDPADELIQYLKDNTSVNIIYPKQKMLKANKTTPIYFKTDHHWTKKGAYIGYSELMRYIQSDFRNVKILKESELTPYYDKQVSEWWNKKLNNGQTFNRMRLPKSYAKHILDTDYLYYKNPYKKYLVHGDLYKIALYKPPNDDEFYYPHAENKKVMIIGNSYARNLVEFIPYSFRYTVRFYDNYRGMKMDIYEPAIKEFKPEILIINMQTAYMPKLLNLYPNKYSNEGEE